MSEDEFRADLRWPIDPLGERTPAHPSGDDSQPWSPPPELEGAGAGELALVEEVGRLSDRLLERMRGLRVAVEADMAEIRAEIAAIRQSVSKATERAGLAPRAGAGRDAGALHDELSALRASVDAVAASVSPDRLDDLADELAGVQTELVALRRRISLRAPDAEGPSLSDEQLARLAAAVAAQLRRDGGRAGP